MKTGYKIINHTISKYDDCILVLNYNSRNYVHNLPMQWPTIIYDRSVGVWKIKRQKYD